MPTTTSRLGLAQPLTVDAVSELRIAIVGNATALDRAARYFEGTLSNRSAVVASPIAGDEYYATDAGQRQVFNGASWDTVVASGNLWFSAASTAPDGWLLCDGSAISRSTYATLFAAISTTYGTGNGSTTFNLPDFRGRTIIGAGTGSGLTARSRGQTGGEETHLLSTWESGVNGNGTTTGTHLAVSSSGWASFQPVLGGGGGDWVAATPGGLSDTTAVSLNARNADSAHNTMQPYGVANVFIKT